MAYRILKKLKYHFLYCRFGSSFVPDKPFFIKIYNTIIKLIHFKEIKIRKKIPTVQENIKIDDKKGFNVIDEDLIFNDDQLVSLSKLKEKYSLINWDEDQDIDRRKDFLLTKDINFDKDLKSVSNGLLPIVSNYIGLIPVLLNASYWYSPNTTNVNKRSQSWHMDQGDIKNIKIRAKLTIVLIK